MIVSKLMLHKFIALQTQSLKWIKLMPLSHFGEFDGDSTANQFAVQSQRIRSAVSVESQSMANPMRMRCELIILIGKCHLQKVKLNTVMSNLGEELGLLVAEEEILLVTASILVAN